FNEILSSKFLTSIGGAFSSTFGAAANVLVILLLAIYLASEPQTYITGLIKLFPIGRRERIRDVAVEIGETLRWWLVGKFFSMLIIGFLTTIGLSIIGVPLALSLGIVAALLAFIPNFGPIVAVIPAVLFALAESPVKAIYVLILYLSIQLVESYLITPMIERETVSLPPVLTIFFQIFLGVLVGGLGLILATPLLTVIIVIVKMLYIEDILGDSDVTLPVGDNEEPSSA
ncbi:MAG: AI-2E family transporter, partial [Acidobacteria bacterium]|nr:AI-2E family transporter [Acidobacteriota bacterium]